LQTGAYSNYTNYWFGNPELRVTFLYLPTRYNWTQNNNITIHATRLLFRRTDPYLTIGIRLEEFVLKTRTGIIRVVHEQSRTKAWVAVIRRTSGKISRTFSDGVHGGYHAAYRAAVAWRGSMLPRYPAQTRVAKMKTISKNNRSGTPGVYRWPADGSDRADAYWGAQWTENPLDKPTRRKFYIATYGEKRAERLAINARKAALEKMSHSPSAMNMVGTIASPSAPNKRRTAKAEGHERRRQGTRTGSAGVGA
jgi:hypothetical protein